MVANHCFITEAFIELIPSKQLIRHEQARMVHWTTELIRSNPTIRSVFSVLLRDARNSSCGLNGTVSSRAEKLLNIVCYKYKNSY